MELLGLLAIGIVIGIPVMAIVALVRSGSTRRLAEDSSYKISELQGDVARLQREIRELSGRVENLSKSFTASAAAVEGQEPQRAAQPVATPSVQVAPAVKPAAEAPAEQVARVETPPAPPLAPEIPAIPKAPEPAQMPSPARKPEPAVSATFRQVPPEIAAFRAAGAGAGAEKVSAPPPPPPAPRPHPTTAEQPPFAQQPRRAETMPAAAPSFAHYEAAPPRESFVSRLRGSLPFEEFLGMNLFAKVGIVLLVLGFAWLGRMEFGSMGPGARVALIYAVAGVLLGGGVWLENRERYRLVGRTGIGGGWALLFFTTYAMNHVAAMAVLASNAIDCVLMLIVAVVMVAHTLRYRSQLVTGLAFLLAFSTVALSQDSVYALVAGVILAIGIVAIALRMSWFELEVFGILTSYANHFYWLYKLYPDGVAGHAFPQFWPSAIILVLYWAIFRASYIARRISAPREESISTVAALLNTILLLVVLKFQATHPELAFRALLGLGALEFILGQLPVTRRRRAAFVLLTVIGTLLVFAAAPFKFTGNNIALFWMIAAEALLIAGIVQFERLFRILGLLGGVFTGALVVYESWGIFELRQSSESPLVKDGILLLTCGALFYLNALFIGRKWRELLNSYESAFTTMQSYLGCVTVFLGMWAIFAAEWTAVAWAALLFAAALGVRSFNDKHLLAQAWALAVAAGIRAAVFNCDFANPYPHHIAARLITIPMLAVVVYLAAWALSKVRDSRQYLYWSLLWAGSTLLAVLAWLELPQPWVAPVWAAMAIALCLIGRWIKLPEVTYQEHVLAAAATVQLILSNVEAPTALERYLPMLGCATAFYAISRFCTQAAADYRRPAAWAHTWVATGLVALLAWRESPQPWLTVVWALFAVGLAIFDRIFDVEELPYQAHVLAALAVVRAASLNLFVDDKWHGVSLRLVTVGILVVALYVLARWVRLPQSLSATEDRHVYTWVAAGLASWLLWRELQPISVAPALASFGLLLFEIGAWKKQRQLRFQSYTLLAASFARIFFVNLSAATLPGEALSPRIYTVAPLALIFFYVWMRLQSTQAKPETGRWSASDLIAYFGTGWC